jgi:hypothetical protein
LGLEFKVNNAAGITISQLGAFDHQGNGITGSLNGGVRVAIFNKVTRTIVPGLDATIIGNADAYSGNHRMKNISPVTLMPGDYVLVAKGYNSTELNGNTEGRTTYPAGDLGNGAISYASTCLYGSAASGFAYPTTIDGGPGNRYLAGTFSYAVITGNSTTSTATSNSYFVTITAKDISGNISHATATVTMVCGKATLPPRPELVPQQAPLAPETLLERKNYLKVYPNPTRGQFSVQLAQLKAPQVTVQILNESGKIVNQRTIKLQAGTSALKENFDITGLASGVYLVRVISTQGTEVSKVILMK